MTLRETLLRFGRKALIIPPILAGIALLLILKRQHEEKGPMQKPPTEASRPLRVIKVEKMPFVPRVLGYGTARPGDVWTAVAEVKGRVTWVHPELKAGAIISEETKVLQIDRRDYELTRDGLLANIAQIEAQQEELVVQELNLREALVIELEALDLAERDLARVKELQSANAAAEATYDESKRAVLTQRQAIQSLNSQLYALPSQRAALEATLRAKQASLDQALRDLERTAVIAPFDCRVGNVALEVDQFLTAGQILFEAHGVAVTEVEAQIPIDQVRRLLVPRDEAIDLSGNAMDTVREVFDDVEAIVRMRTGDFVVEWEGEFDRIREELDLQTRTLRIVVAVKGPYQNVKPGERPPLSPGMFCEVELRGTERQDKIVVPRASVRYEHEVVTDQEAEPGAEEAEPGAEGSEEDAVLPDQDTEPSQRGSEEDAVTPVPPYEPKPTDRRGFVFLVDADQRLVKQGVWVAYSQGAMSVIASDLKPGDQLVVSDATPAVERMLVEPTTDERMAEDLKKMARGEGDVR